MDGRWQARKLKELGVTLTSSGPDPLCKGSQPRCEADVFIPILKVRKLSLRGDTCYILATQLIIGRLGLSNFFLRNHLLLLRQQWPCSTGCVGQTGCGW